MFPFKKNKNDAVQAFEAFCKKRPLLPRLFLKEQTIQKISGLYVPFWLYDCAGDFSGSYKAQRVHTWSDANYNYTKTDHYLLKRSSAADFVGIPMDGKTRLELATLTLARLCSTN